MNKMKFQFGEQSKLHGRCVRTPICRYALNEDEINPTEHIFVYNQDRVPNQNEEPELYLGSRVEQVSNAEVTLRYDRIDEIILMLTLREDNAFRRENAKIVSDCEKFRIDA